MTTTMINLLVIGKGWQEFQYGAPECQQQLKDNGIYIGSDTSIGYRAFIGHSAVIGDRAFIGRGAVIGSRAFIGHSAVIGDDASIGDRASIGGDAVIGSRASIRDDASIGDDAFIGDRAKPKTIFITGSRHSVNYWGEDKIQIGCIQKSIAEWEKEYAKVGIENSYSQDEIAEYRRYIEMIKAFHQSNQSK